MKFLNRPIVAISTIWSDQESTSQYNNTYIPIIKSITSRNFL